MKVTKDLDHCAVCGEYLISLPIYGKLVKGDTSLWDQYFHTICVAVASKSPCLSRQIGAILVRDHSIVSTGFNGPSRGVPHCGHERLIKDSLLGNMPKPSNAVRFKTECPRKVYGYESGTHMELCPAQHAEENAISNAARLGVSVLGATLYMNCIIPCKGCFGSLINAGIVEIVVDDIKVYDKHTQYLIDNSSIKIRRFEL
jgi:dCMP deaminase